jgi:hypothetical protein
MHTGAPPPKVSYTVLFEWALTRRFSKTKVEFGSSKVDCAHWCDLSFSESDFKENFKYPII